MSDDHGTSSHKSALVLDKDDKMEYLRYIDGQVRYYKSLLESPNLLPAKRRQLTDKYTSLKASRKKLRSQYQDSILEADKKDEVKIAASDVGISENSPGVDENTLLKSLPFRGWGKEVDDRVTERVNQPNSIHNPEKLELLKLTTLYPGSKPIRAGPVLNVISVSISKRDGSDWEEFEIYGQISTTDEKSNTFYIYNCERNDPELICPKFNRLYLGDGPVTPVYLGGRLKFSLFKNDDDIQILEGDFDLDYTSEDVNEKKFIIKCGDDKDEYCATMEFIKIPFACVAKVGMFLCDTTGNVGNFDVYGTIKVNNILCFEAPSTEPVSMTYGVENGLRPYRAVIAIPVYSALVVEIKLQSGDNLIADDEVEIFPDGLMPRVKHVYCKNRSYCLFINVVWTEYDKFIVRGGGFKWVNNVNVKWNAYDNNQINELPAAVNSKCALVEVFSVYVGGGDSAPLSLCGSIVVRDCVQNKTAYIFARNSDFPDVLSNDHYGISNLRSRVVSLEWPSDHWFVEEDFYMDVKLKDTQDTEICWGGHCWWHKPGNSYPERYDKRLCDVIKGDTGYFVAVHYSIFYNGKKAKVTVEWKGPDCAVFGSIDAEYINYSYPSTYHKTYYQNIIFKRSWKDCLEVKSSSEIQLAKSHISAPSDCQGLIVNINLHVADPEVNKSSPLGGHILKFKAGETEVKKGEHVSVKVEWVQ